MSDKTEDMTVPTRTPQSVADYYRGYHHKLVTWYITIQGFIMAGVFASPKEPPRIGWLVVIYMTVVFIVFLFQLLTFSYRIRLLEAYGNNPPQDWFQKHKKDARPWGGGEGTFFFVTLMIVLGLINCGLLHVKDYF